MSKQRKVTVFGGTGFVGRRVVSALIASGWSVCVPTRDPATSKPFEAAGQDEAFKIVQADLKDAKSVECALIGANACINLVALLFETDAQTFRALHVEGAENIARACVTRGISNVAHVSAIGADKNSPSDYARTKAIGEQRVRHHLPHADIFRPSIIFGEGDGFFTRFAQMARLAPALPLIGGGTTKFQPVFVEDVAAAIVGRLNAGTDGTIYELGGPSVYSFKDLLRFTLRTIGKHRLLMPIPWAMAYPMGLAGEISGRLPGIDPFLTRDQVHNLKSDNVVNSDLATFAELNINPASIDEIVPTYLARFR